jgi:hypothetical protein
VDGTNLGCELKRGFAHLLLEHEFDVAPLINDAEAWVEERSAELEMTAISFKWDISALKILSGGGQAVLEEPDVFGAGAAEKALAVGGVAAVALGIAGDRAWPYARNSMRLVIAGPTGPDTQRESDGPREDGPDRTPTRQLGQLSLAWRQSRAGERATPRRAIHVQADGRDLSGNPAVLERHTLGHWAGNEDHVAGEPVELGHQDRTPGAALQQTLRQLRPPVEGGGALAGFPPRRTRQQ